MQRNTPSQSLSFGFVQLNTCCSCFTIQAVWLFSLKLVNKCKDQMVVSLLVLSIYHCLTLSQVLNVAFFVFESGVGGSRLPVLPLRD